jgi:hypothetical protein
MLRCSLYMLDKGPNTAHLRAHVSEDNCWLIILCCSMLLLLGTCWGRLLKLQEFKGMSWELFGNMVGTLWEHQKISKSKPFLNQLLSPPKRNWNSPLSKLKIRGSYKSWTRLIWNCWSRKLDRAFKCMGFDFWNHSPNLNLKGLTFKM